MSKVRSRAEIQSKIRELRDRLGKTTNRTAMTVLNAQIEALEWALGES